MSPYLRRHVLPKSTTSITLRSKKIAKHVSLATMMSPQKTSIKVGDVVSFDYTKEKSGWIGVVTECGFINSQNKYEKQIKVQQRWVEMTGKKRFLLGGKNGDEAYQVLEQATKCCQIRKNKYALVIPKTVDNTYNSLRQLTNPDKLESYQMILKHLDHCCDALLMESELLVFTKYLKTRFTETVVDIPNPMAASFPSIKIPYVFLYPSTFQEFIKGHAQNRYDFVWQDLCKTLLHENKDILPLIVSNNIVRPGGHLAITCSLRKCDYIKSMRIIKRDIGNEFTIVTEKRYWPSMLFCLLKRNKM